MGLIRGERFGGAAFLRKELEDLFDRQIKKCPKVDYANCPNCDSLDDQIKRLQNSNSKLDLRMLELKTVSEELNNRDFSLEDNMNSMSEKMDELSVSSDTP